MKKFSGFTLIELLIVVAIIAILAAIAVPNFLEAQTRAKVSRVKSDLRSMGTAIETYRIDHNHVPLDYAVTRSGDPVLPGQRGANVSGILHPGCRMPDGTIRIGLTTPVSYITNCWVEDPFVGRGGGNLNFDEQVYTYNVFWKGTLMGISDDKVEPTYRDNNYPEFYGNYRLGSIGPDRSFYNPLPGETSSNGFYSAAWSQRRHSMVYDATNGTLSIGNIWRSEKESEVTNRPRADRLKL